MSTPTGDNTFLRELERGVRAELALAETSQPEEETVGVPIDEWRFDPADAQREEVGLRSLLGAVEAVEEGSRPGDHPPTAARQSKLPASAGISNSTVSLTKPDSCTRFGSTNTDDSAWRLRSVCAAVMASRKRSIVAEIPQTIGIGG